MTDNVEVTARCPVCGKDATWQGKSVAGGDTSYVIRCAVPHVDPEPADEESE